MKKYILLIVGLISGEAFAQKNFYISPSIFSGKTTIRQELNNPVEFNQVGGPGSLSVNPVTTETGTSFGGDMELGVELNKFGMQIGASYGTMVVNKLESNFSNIQQSVNYNYTLSNLWFGVEYALINTNYLRIAPALNSGSYDIKSSDPGTQIDYMLKNKLTLSPALNIIVKIRRLGIWIKPNYDYKFFKQDVANNENKGSIKSWMVSGGVRYYLIREKEKQ